jgi:hypothetical protein
VSDWEVLQASARGSVHVRDGTPPQDAVAWWPGPDAGAGDGWVHRAAEVVVAVSDGVGSRDCFRSDRGSYLAAMLACAMGADLLRTGVPADELAGRLMADVAVRWRTAVQGDLAEQPVTADERAGVSAGWSDGDPVLAYAATLLVAVATPTALALVQLGDGDLLLVDDGGRVGCPMPADPSSVAGSTSSLARADAAAVARTALVDAGAVAAALLATDGYGNAFADPDWQGEVGRDVCEQLVHDGPTAVRERLDSWVGDAAAVGGDDATLAILWRAEM